MGSTAQCQIFMSLIIGISKYQMSLLNDNPELLMKRLSSVGSHVEGVRSHKI